MIRFSENFRTLRKVNGLTQQELADALELNLGTIGAYEEKRGRPKYEGLVKISQFFKVSIDDLITREMEEKREIRFK